MICPHCGNDTDAPLSAPSVTLLPNVNGCAAQPYPIITNGNSQISWSNTVCAAGAAQPVGDIRYITFGRTHNE